MESRVERLRIGVYRAVRQLPPGSLAERWVSVHEADQSVHIAHRFRAPDKAAAQEVAEALAAAAGLSHPHLLPIEAVVSGVAGSTWAVTPFTGNHDGLVTLASLVRDKGGRMSPAEAERALIQLLEVIAYAHSQGFHHGPVSPEEILVDRRGSLAIELYGLRRRLNNVRRPASEIARDEVRSIVEIGYFLITGLSAEEPRILAARMFPKLDRRWDDWFNEGLDPLAGFATADEALAALPGLRREVEGREKVSPVTTVIRRFRRAIGPA